MNSYFLPQNLLNHIEKPILLDTFGILSKSKLLLREPISGSQISFCSADYNHSQANDERGVSLKSENGESVSDNQDEQVSNSTCEASISEVSNSNTDGGNSISDEQDSKEENTNVVNLDLESGGTEV